MGLTVDASIIVVGEGDAIGVTVVGVFVGVVSPDVATVGCGVPWDGTAEVSELASNKGSSNCGREFTQRMGELSVHVGDR